MLYVCFGLIRTPFEKFVTCPNEWYRLNAEPEWFRTQWTKEVIEKIDNSICHDMYNIESPILGGINYAQISSGASLLISARFGDCVWNGNRSGDNCFPLLYQLSKDKDVYISTTYLSRYVPENFTAYVVNTERLVSTKDEYIDELLKWKSLSDPYYFNGSHLMWEEMTYRR